MHPFLIERLVRATIEAAGPAGDRIPETRRDVRRRERRERRRARRNA